MRRDRIGPPCRGSGRRTSPSCAPVNPFCHALRARGPGGGLPAATGSLANAIGRAKTAEGLGRAFSPAFRARVWVPKNLARRVLIYWFRRRDAARPDRAAMPRIGPANLSIVRPPFTPSVTLYAREGQAVVCPLLRGRSPTRSVAPKQPRASGVLSLRHFGLARGCRRIWRGEFAENKSIANQSPLLKLSLRRVRFQRTSTRQQLDRHST